VHSVSVDIPHVTPPIRVILPYRVSRAFERAIADKAIHSSETGILRYLDSLGYFSRSVQHFADTTIITAGESWRLSSVRVFADSDILIDSINRIILPQPYNASIVNSLVRQVVNYFCCRGYPYASVSVHIDTVGIQSVGVLCEVTKGNPCVFGLSRFIGAKKTWPSLLAADVSWVPGSVYDVRAVRESEERLRTRTYIATVTAGQPAVVPASQGVDTIPTHTVVSVPFVIVEQSGLGVDGALGFQSNDDKNAQLSGEATLSLLNAFGRGEEASVYFRRDNTLQLFSVSLRKPRLLLLPVTVSGKFGLEIQENDYGFLSGEATIDWELRRLWHIGFALNGHETTESGASVQYAGVDVMAGKSVQAPGKGILTRDMLLRTGSGAVDRSNGRYYRWKLHIDAGMHMPFAGSWAAVSRLFIRHMSTDAQDTLHETEQFRIGGQEIMRGYGENQFAFNTVAVGQYEQHVYFSSRGSVFIFSDAGIGFRQYKNFNTNDMISMVGYGLGIMIPVKIGVMSLAYARNIDDGQSPGRLHVRVKGSF
jgi:outer membrane protein assembly factor BamA